MVQTRIFSDLQGGVVPPAVVQKMQAGDSTSQQICQALFTSAVVLLAIACEPLNLPGMLRYELLPPIRLNCGTAQGGLVVCPECAQQLW